MFYGLSPTRKRPLLLSMFFFLHLKLIMKGLRASSQEPGYQDQFHVRLIWEISARCYSDMGIPIPKTLVIWPSPSHITLTIRVTVRVRVTGEAHFIRVLEMGMAKTPGCPYHCESVTPPSEMRKGPRLWGRVLAQTSRDKAQFNVSN